MNKQGRIIFGSILLVAIIVIGAMIISSNSGGSSHSGETVAQCAQGVKVAYLGPGAVPDPSAMVDTQYQVWQIAHDDYGDVEPPYAYLHDLCDQVINNR